MLPLAAKEARSMADDRQVRRQKIWEAELGTMQAFNGYR